MSSTASALMAKQYQSGLKKAIRCMHRMRGAEADSIAISASNAVSQMYNYASRAELN